LGHISSEERCNRKVYTSEEIEKIENIPKSVYFWDRSRARIDK
jgi:hypothetical protein